MKHYAGLDVSVKETSVCIVDETGKICREIKVVSHPEDLLQLLQDPAWRFERIGLEAGPLSQWLFEGLAQTGVMAHAPTRLHGVLKVERVGQGPVLQRREQQSA